MQKLNAGTKTFVILLILFFIILVTPNHSIDPWNLFNPKKVVSIIFSLSLIQSLSILAISRLGSKTGAFVTGFLGGLISSTATTATLAKQSHHSSNPELTEEYLAFLSATLAMLVECIFIVVLGSDHLPISSFGMFVAPIMITLICILFLIRRPFTSKMRVIDVQLELLPIIKLSMIIIAVMTTATILQNTFGDTSSLLFTFLTSLFEIHGTLIANVQLYSSNIFSLNTLNHLIALSITASILSKLLLIYIFGSKKLKFGITKFSAILLLSVLLGSLFV